MYKTKQDNNLSVLDWNFALRVGRKQNKLEHNVPNPHFSSRGMPTNARLDILETRWIIPACNQIEEISLHAWCWWTILYQSRAPNFSKLQWMKMHADHNNDQYFPFNFFILFYIFFLGGILHILKKVYFC